MNLSNIFQTTHKKMPTRFNFSMLVQAMKEIHKYIRNDTLKSKFKECYGIGTEAIKAGIIEKLLKISNQNLLEGNYE